MKSPVNVPPAATRYRSSPRRRVVSPRATAFVGLLAILCLLSVLDASGHVAGAPTPPVRHGRPDYYWHPEIAPDGPLVMVVSLEEQYLYVYRNGVAIGASPISSGRPGRETPTGIYTILQKEREHRSNLYADAPMPFMQRLSWDGIAMHGGTLPGHPASHGCIRLPPAFAEKLYDISERGAVVVISDARVSPADIVHPAAVAPIDLAGQPMKEPRPGVDDATSLAAGGRLINVVISTHDRMVYVLRDGRLVASSPLDLSGGDPVRGTLLYVMRRPGVIADADAGEKTTVPMHVWSAYRISGNGEVPGPAQMAARLGVPAAFGQRVRAALTPGTTVLVTDLPGRGHIVHASYGALLQSGQPSDIPR